MGKRIALLLLLLACVLCSLAGAQELSLSRTDTTRHLLRDTETLLDLGAPQVMASGSQEAYRFPGQVFAGGAAVEKTDAGLGQWKETISAGENGLTIRYEFELPADTTASRVTWAWRLDPAVWDGSLITATHGAPEQPENTLALRRIEGVQASNLRSVTIARKASDVTIRFGASDGAWSVREARARDRSRSYRIDYTRPATIEGKRSGWFEVTIGVTTPPNPLVALTTGPSTLVHDIPFAIGELPATVSAKSDTLVFLHTLSTALPPGDSAGEIVITYADSTRETFTLRSEETFTSPGDDPRDVVNGRLATLADGKPAWISRWRNPQPGMAIERIEPRSVAGDWRLLAVSAVDASAAAHRAEMALRSAVPAPAHETRISLDGAWQFSAANIDAREITVPSFWDRQEGLQDVHAATYSRKFDLPASLAGQRIFIRLDAIGDAGEIWVNGHMAGRQVSAGLPVEVEITPLVTIPSAANTLEVRVQDDTHFGIAIDAPPWRAAKHWIPRGMGTNNRKGLYQSAALVARPAIHVSDVRIQTSVRKGELTAIYKVRNTRKEAAKVRIAPSVRRSAGGEAILSLPATEIELPGYVTTEVTVRGPFSGVELWQPDHPTLYTLRTLITEGDKRHQRADTRFGFRQVWFEGVNFYLNGIRCNLRGESPAYPEKLEMMSSRATAAEMIRRYQDMNFNVLRFHAMPAPPHVLDLCDEMGMLVIDESSIYASWSMLMPEHADFMANCRDHLTRWVKRDRNHPSVVMWSADNEGLNVNLLTPAQLSEFAQTVMAEDGTRPVTFDGDGSGMGASPASVKHYVGNIDDLKHRGGVASGYARDLRNDIYWATEYQQDIPLGCGEFLYPEGRQRSRERELAYMMGLQTRGYRLANWFDIRPYNPSMIGFLEKSGTREGFQEAQEIIRKSFAAVAVFDKAYDALGPYPEAPVLTANQPVGRELIVYNDTFADENVEVEWIARCGDERIAGERLTRQIPLGDHIVIPIGFTAPAPGELQLDLISRKGGKETYRDTRPFAVK